MAEPVNSSPVQGKSQDTQQGVAPSPSTKRSLQFDLRGMSNKLIQFRVTLVKSYTTKKGGVPFGKFYALDDSVEIPCVVYDEIWSKWKDLLKVNACLSMKMFKVDLQDSQYESLTGTDLQLSLNRRTEIKVIENFPVVIPYNFKTLGEINSCEVGSYVDLRAIVVQTNEKEHDNNGKVRRHINLLDETGQVCVTLCGSDASDFGDEEGFPILIRNAAVQVYDGTKMLNTYPYTSIWKSPDIHCKRLEEFWIEAKAKKEQMLRDEEEEDN